MTYFPQQKDSISLLIYFSIAVHLFLFILLIPKEDLEIDVEFQTKNIEIKTPAKRRGELAQAAAKTDASESRQQSQSTSKTTESHSQQQTAPRTPSTPSSSSAAVSETGPVESQSAPSSSFNPESQTSPQSENNADAYSQLANKSSTSAPQSSSDFRSSSSLDLDGPGDANTSANNTQTPGSEGIEWTDGQQRKQVPPIPRLNLPAHLRGIEAEAELSFTVDPGGEVIDVSLQRSSLTSELDQLLIKHMKSHQFEPLPSVFSKGKKAFKIKAN